jgi:hypothetical protein
MVKAMDDVLSSYVEADHCKSNSMLEIWKLNRFTGKESFLDVQHQCNGLITNVVDYVCYIQSLPQLFILSRIITDVI